MRIILRCNRRTGIEEMLEALHFMSIRKRVEYKVCIFIRKMVNGEYPTYSRNRIELVGTDGGIPTRQRGITYGLRNVKRLEKRKCCFMTD